jgi:hypothetical protein
VVLWVFANSLFRFVEDEVKKGVEKECPSAHPAPVCTNLIERHGGPYTMPLVRAERRMKMSQRVQWILRMVQLILRTVLQSLMRVQSMLPNFH